ncbi:hypothetical protein LTR56_012884 [Elasticomyces elasticus]|nr:hypothetical protein LTR56_012884 [Elasticomyces elasticus]KAK3650810.1 hypothetical protein LTR22_012409 [Elasticomyces elasticus]KAK4918514.1 hypothetical protein LTR49_013747 [Elasticomyces elasticus]KAK5757848.1 hypothetical protein LTS12_012032 [Elasticomyces elasticus]
MANLATYKLLADHDPEDEIQSMKGEIEDQLDDKLSKDTIVIVGSGIAGFTLARKLDEEKFNVVVISPEETSPHTSLLVSLSTQYVCALLTTWQASAACGSIDFSFAEEQIRHKSRSLTYYKARVEDVDFIRKVCRCRSACDVPGGKDRLFEVKYDRLILAPGCATYTFDIPGADEHALFLRTAADARHIHHRLTQLLELASIPHVSADEQRRLLHIIIVGTGPAGIELAGKLSDLIEGDLAALYPELKDKISISIHDSRAYHSGRFEAALRQYCLENSPRRHVQLFLDSHITNVEADSVTTEALGRVPCGMVIWTPGSKQSLLVDKLKVAKTSDSDSGVRRMLTDEYLHVLTPDPEQKAMSHVYALGDAADIKDGSLPPTAEVARQKAEYLAEALNAASERETAFEYQQQHGLLGWTGGNDGVVQGQTDWTPSRAWAAWRSGSSNSLFARSSRYNLSIAIHWFADWVRG